MQYTPDTLNDKDKLLHGLRARLSQEESAFEAAGLPDRVRLNKTQFFASQKKQVTISRHIAALKTAIDVIEKPSLAQVDTYQGILMGIPDRNREEKDELLQKAESIYLNERKAALRVLFETSLPILKKQVIGYLS